MLEHTMIVGRADNYHVIAIGHVKVSENPPTCVGDSLSPCS